MDFFFNIHCMRILSLSCYGIARFGGRASPNQMYAHTIFHSCAKNHPSKGKQGNFFLTLQRLKTVPQYPPLVLLTPLPLPSQQPPNIHAPRPQFQMRGRNFYLACTFRLTHRSFPARQ